MILSNGRKLTNGLQITHLILFSPKPSTGASSSISRVLFKVVVAIERLFLLRNERHHDHLHEFDLSPLVQNTIRLNSIAGQENASRDYSDEDVRRVKALNLDLLITFDDAPRGDILTTAKLGVISVCYGDNPVHRGDLAGFWEVYFREDTTGFSLQRLVGGGGAGVGDAVARSCRHPILLSAKSSSALRKNESLFEKTHRECGGRRRTSGCAS